MRSLWQRIVQSIFGKPYTLQGNWMGWQVHDDIDCENGFCDICNFDDTWCCEDWDCALCEDDDTIGE